MKTNYLFTLASALALSAAGAAAQDEPEMVGVLVGTVVQVPIDQAATACGLTADEIRATIAGQVSGATAAEDGASANDVAGEADASGEVATRGEQGGIGGHAVGQDTTAPGNTALGTGNMTNPAALGGPGLAGINAACMIGQEAAAQNNFPMGDPAGQ
jgi:hypothetical protein